MSDPTIRISTCRQDGRCPECGEPTVDLEPAQVCGCSVCFSVACVAKHSRDVLTEALRQLHMQELCTFDANGHADAAIKSMETLREERDAAIREHQRALGEAAEIAQGLQSKLDEAIRERDLARAHDAQPYPTAEAYERVCAALEATKRSLEQTRAAMEAGDACTVCAGTGKPVSGKPCICGGHGGIGNQIIGLTREVQRERERADRAEALLREIQPMVVQAVLDPYPVVRERASALLAKIREVVEAK